MKKSQQLKQLRSAKLDEQKTIVQEARSQEGGNLTDEQRTRFDALQGEIENLDQDIRRWEQIEENEVRSIAATGQVVTGNGDDAEERDFGKLVKRYSLHRAIRSEMNNKPLTGAEAEVQQELSKRAAATGGSVQGIILPMGHKRASQSVTGDSGNYGGALVSEDLSPNAIEFLRPAPVVESLGAEMVTDLVGDAAWAQNKGGVAASWEGELDATPQTRNQWDKKTMQPNRLCAVVGISLQNLVQTSGAVERLTVQDINRAFAAALDAAAINGSGSGEPTGILNTAGIGDVAIGTNGGAPTWKAMVDLETAVLNSNYAGNNYSYLLNPSTAGYLKTLSKAGTEAIFVMESGEVNGYNVGISSNVPSNLTKGTGTDLSAAIFGDFSQLIIGQWGFMDLVVDRVTQAKSGIIELTVNSFYDVMVRQEGAFAAVKDLDLS